MVSPRKKNFRDYPESYFAILEHFDVSTDDYVVEGIHSELMTARHDLYRFREALSRAYKEDRYAKRLADIFRNLTVSVQPTDAKGTDPSILIIKLNPLTKAIIKANRPRR